MENMNAIKNTTASTWNNDPDCFINLLDSREQVRRRNARRRKDENRRDAIKLAEAACISVATVALTFFIICVAF